MKKLKLNIVLILTLCFSNIKAQTVITLQAAIDTALYNNLGLRISRNEAEIADNNATRANAGQLPSVGIVAGTTQSNTNLTQVYSTGGELNKTGVINKTYNGQLGLTWTLFDGTRMFATYEKLQVLKNMGDLNVQMRTEELISDVTNSYSNMVRQKLLLQGTKNNITVYQERVKLSNTRVEIGKAARTEFLQASVDLNSQNNNLAMQETSYKNSAVELNRLMMRPPAALFDVTDSLEITPSIELESLLSKIENGNRQLQQLRMTQQQRALELQVQKSYSYPKVDLNAGYNFAKSSSSQGLFLKNQSYGPLVGLSLNWNVFNGNVLRKQIENSKIVLENSKLQYDDAANTLKGMLVSAWQRYHDAVLLSAAERDNYKMSNENLQITTERFKLNEATILELKDAQQINEASLLRLADILYIAKTAETELMFMTGQLVK
ncbi:MAG: TolC family protein [Bacteroidia bacterium]|nr:TolC family protein [Bacteroidia bacterium]